MFNFTNLKIFLIILLTSVTCLTGAFSGNIEKKDMTIGEIKTNIKKLKEEKEEVNNSWKKFLEQNGEIKNFLKTNLKKEDIKKILFLAEKVGESNDRRKKVEFYKKLFPFIIPNQKKNFFAYIKKETTKLDKQKIIKKEIIIQKKVLDKKVKKYSKIKENYEKKTNILLEKVIRKQIVNIINGIESKESFKKLKKSKIVFIYKNFVKKLYLKKEKLLKRFDKNNSKMGRTLIILNVMIEEIEKSIKKFQ